MKRFKNYAIVCFTAMLILSMTGCRSNVAGEKTYDNPTGNANAKQAAVNWETKEYEDTYLTYQIPSNWEINPNYSDESKRLVFFSMSEANSDNPSNINVQITNLTNKSKGLDYGDASIQEDFHTFLISEAGLPSEAKDGKFKVFQTEDFYVYTISFSRTTKTGSMVQQTAYVPVGLDYSIMIWATDWKDNTSPSVEEVATHICNTLEIKNPPAK